VSAVFRLPVRVYYQDTDAGGVVFHAQYLAFMERARTEFLNERGFDLSRFCDESRILFMVHGITVRYHRPAKLNELLCVTAEVASLRTASLVFRQRVERGGELLVEAEVRLALVDRDRLSPVRMPDSLKRLLGKSKMNPTPHPEPKSMTP
jgi:tol-pal system-associated acyl-CoA thioesterase